MATTDTNKVIFYGENPGIKLQNAADDAEALTHASFWCDRDQRRRHGTDDSPHLPAASLLLL